MIDVWLIHGVTEVHQLQHVQQSSSMQATLSNFHVLVLCSVHVPTIFIYIEFEEFMEIIQISPEEKQEHKKLKFEYLKISV